MELTDIIFTALEFSILIFVLILGISYISSKLKKPAKKPSDIQDLVPSIIKTKTADHNKRQSIIKQKRHTPPTFDRRTNIKVIKHQLKRNKYERIHTLIETKEIDTKKLTLTDLLKYYDDDKEK